MGYTRGLGTAILIYLACGERGNEEIIDRPKDESEFLAKKKTFEANIFKGSLFQSFGALQIKTLTRSLCSTICNIYASWKFFTCPTPHTPWKFLPFNPPPHPLGISIDHPLGGYFLEPHIFIFQYLCKPSVRSLEKKKCTHTRIFKPETFQPKILRLPGLNLTTLPNCS